MKVLFIVLILFLAIVFGKPFLGRHQSYEKTDSTKPYTPRMRSADRMLVMDFVPFPKPEIHWQHEYALRNGVFLVKVAPAQHVPEGWHWYYYPKQEYASVWMVWYGPMRWIENQLQYYRLCWNDWRQPRRPEGT